ncbi:LysR family transcriptional regulator [Izhakiella australiensis]|uniref:LysR family transcriptional regulator n=1 Tax=Izhakiella australiensis TaxID=1926881 RepID=A0A1S8YQQ9_9GAMM|nr:LysR family transcriptional regulator [Izhakiella australiensis]OON41489.1 LysR family transcriptional regulator [Izhakiella australiensis]
MPRDALPLNAIHAFLITARHQNLTHAAQELCITQGAVSRKIAALEQWLGFSLFERHARGLRLTLQGSALLPELRSGYLLMERALQLASQQQVPLRLRAPTCALRWLLPRLMTLEKSHPALHVALTTTLEHRNQLDQFDAAIVYGPPQPAALCLFEEYLTPVMAPNLMLSQPTRPQHLNGLTFLHPGADATDWRLWLGAESDNVTMSRNQHFSTMDLAIGAAIEGFGVTVADVTLVAGDIAANRLIAPFSQRVRTGAVYSLIVRPAGQAHWLQEVLQQHLCQNATHSSLELAASDAGFGADLPGSR